jgi:hypothetical protein
VFVEFSFLSRAARLTKSARHFTAHVSSNHPERTTACIGVWLLVHRIDVRQSFLSRSLVDAFLPKNWTVSKEPIGASFVCPLVYAVFPVKVSAFRQSSCSNVIYPYPSMKSASFSRGSQECWWSWNSAWLLVSQRVLDTDWLTFLREQRRLMSFSDKMKSALVEGAKKSAKAPSSNR